jgi:hypothetical protein
MFVFNNWLEQTGTIIYENTQELVSGLVSYETPYVLTTGTTFAVVRRDTFVKKSDESHRSQHDILITQFGQGEIDNLNDTGIYLKAGRTRLRYDGEEFRAMKVNDFGQKFVRFMPVGVVEVRFERRKPLA